MIAVSLDWMLNRRKPRPGHEHDFARLDEEFRSLMVKHEEGTVGGAQYESSLRKIQAGLDRAGVSPFEIIGCPRVGIDEEATRWFRDRLYAPNHDAASRDPRPAGAKEEFVAHWGRPLEEVLKDYYGKWVPVLAKQEDGLAQVRGIMGSAVDFRGQIVGCAGELIGEELASEAYEDHAAAACRDYALRLQSALGDYVGGHPEAENSPPMAEATQDLRAAVRWLQYWGERGFGYEAWY